MYPGRPPYKAFYNPYKPLFETSRHQDPFKAQKLPNKNQTKLSFVGPVAVATKEVAVAVFTKGEVEAAVVVPGVWIYGFSA